MNTKYVHKTNRMKGQCKGSGNAVNPALWKTGTDPVRRDKYYAFLKHKAQAKYRKEEYHLDFDQWESLWPDDLWHCRGKTSQSLCLARKDFTREWSLNNVEIVERIVQIRRQREYKNVQ